MNSAFQSLQRTWDRLDERMVQFMSDNGIRLIRIALAIVFIWFGILKVVGQSPVYDLVAKTVYLLPPELFVPFLGVWETVIGIGLLFGRALRVTLLLFWLQMAGTFLVLIVRPDIAFQGGNPLIPTNEGQYVIKNLVLISAGIVIGATVRYSERGRTT